MAFYLHSVVGCGGVLYPVFHNKKPLPRKLSDGHYRYAFTACDPAARFLHHLVFRFFLRFTVEGAVFFLSVLIFNTNAALPAPVLSFVRCSLIHIFLRLILTFYIFFIDKHRKIVYNSSVEIVL